MDKQRSWTFKHRQQCKYWWSFSILNDLNDGSKVIGFPSMSVRDFIKREIMINKELPFINKVQIQDSPHREPMLLLDNLFNIIPMKSR